MLNSYRTRTEGCQIYLFFFCIWQRGTHGRVRPRENSFSLVWPEMNIFFCVCGYVCLHSLWPGGGARWGCWSVSVPRKQSPAGAREGPGGSVCTAPRPLPFLVYHAHVQRFAVCALCTCTMHACEVDRSIITLLSFTMCLTLLVHHRVHVMCCGYGAGSVAVVIRACCTLVATLW